MKSTRQIIASTNLAKALEDGMERYGLGEMDMVDDTQRPRERDGRLVAEVAVERSQYKFSGICKCGRPISYNREMCFSCKAKAEAGEGQ